MSYKEHRFLFWTWKTHKHEWVEEDRNTCGRIYFHSPKEMPPGAIIPNPITMFLYRCADCGERKVEKLDGAWPGVKK